MLRNLRRAIAVAASTLLAGVALAPSAQADIVTFSDVGAHITGVRVSHGPATVGVTAYDGDLADAMYYRFWLDTDSSDPGPEYKAEVYPNSDGIFLMRVANFASGGRKFHCSGFRAIADAYGADYAKIIVPRNCIGAPGRVRVAVVGYYDEDSDPHIDVVDWAPGEERFYPWVNR
jgi:hypothetical protein